MRHAKQTPTPALIVLALLVSLLTVVIPKVAAAAEYVPDPKYPPITVGRHSEVVSGPSGTMTLPCNATTDVDLVTYSQTGTIARKLDRTTFLDGVANCINRPVVDKNNVLYGITHGKNTSGTFVTGQYLYAFAGSNLKWKYPVFCGQDQPSSVVVGADGNIYATTKFSDGVHLIGVAPNLTVGAAQPLKVMDVKIPNDCSIQLKAYRDGIVAHGQNSGHALYYSYAGKFLGQATIGDVWYEKINAEGQLFVGKFVTGSGFKSVSISKYDPRSGTVVWTTSASVPGADTSGFALYPLPNGSITAHITQQRMTADGLPAVPKEWLDTLVTLNASGQKVKSTALSKKDAQGNIYNYPNISVDTSGKLVVVRHMDKPTGLEYPATIAAISVGVYDPLLNTWPYQKVITGDLGKTGGPSGYFFTKGPALTDNTVALLANCSGNCTGTKGRLFALKVSGLGMDYPRGLLVTASPRSSAYLAIGDSFSSGESLEPFEQGTNISNVNQCHRSNLAYPKVIAGRSTKIPPLNQLGFRACAGSTSDNIWLIGKANEGIQLDWWPDKTTQLVTLTIGGNDVDLADFAQNCILPLTVCEEGSPAYNRIVNKITNELPNKLRTVYEKILRYAPNATIYVLNYPYIVPNKSVSDPDDIRCRYLIGGNSKWAEARAAYKVTSLLNNAIGNAINTVRTEKTENHRLRPVVDVNKEGSPFSGHEICGTSATSFFQNVDQALNNSAYVFHPNEKGQDAYATILASEIDNE